MHILISVLAAVVAGVNLHAFIVLGAALKGRGEAPRRRVSALRRVLSGVCAFVLSVVLCGASIYNEFSVGDLEPSARAHHVAEGISAAMNNLA